MEEAIIYCRVSSFKQCSNSIIKHYSLENQERKCKEYCNKNNIKVNEIIKEVSSGKNLNQMKKLTYVKNKILNSNIKYLIIYTPDRLIRNTEQGTAFLNELCNNNKITYFVDDELSYVHFRNKHSIRTSISLAEMEYDCISSRVKNSLIEKNKQKSTKDINQQNKLNFKIKKYHNLGMSINKIKKELLLNNINVSFYYIRNFINKLK